MALAGQGGGGGGSTCHWRLNSSKSIEPLPPSSNRSNMTASSAADGSCPSCRSTALHTTNQRTVTAGQRAAGSDWTGGSGRGGSGRQGQRRRRRGRGARSAPELIDRYRAVAVRVAALERPPQHRVRLALVLNDPQGSGLATMAAVPHGKGRWGRKAKGGGAAGQRAVKAQGTGQCKPQGKGRCKPQGRKGGGNHRAERAVALTGSVRFRVSSAVWTTPRLSSLSWFGARLPSSNVDSSFAATPQRNRHRLRERRAAVGTAEREGTGHRTVLCLVPRWPRCLAGRLDGASPSALGPRMRWTFAPEPGPGPGPGPGTVSSRLRSRRGRHPPRPVWLLSRFACGRPNERATVGGRRSEHSHVECRLLVVAN